MATSTTPGTWSPVLAATHGNVVWRSPPQRQNARHRSWSRRGPAPFLSEAGRSCTPARYPQGQICQNGWVPGGDGWHNPRSAEVCSQERSAVTGGHQCRPGRGDVPCRGQRQAIGYDDPADAQPLVRVSHQRRGPGPATFLPPGRDLRAARQLSDWSAASSAPWDSRWPLIVTGAAEANPGARPHGKFWVEGMAAAIPTFPPSGGEGTGVPMSWIFCSSSRPWIETEFSNAIAFPDRRETGEPARRSWSESATKRLRASPSPAVLGWRCRREGRGRSKHRRSKSLHRLRQRLASLNAEPSGRRQQGDGDDLIVVPGRP